MQKLGKTFNKTLHWNIAKSFQNLNEISTPSPQIPKLSQIKTFNQTFLIRISTVLSNNYKATKFNVSNKRIYGNRVNISTVTSQIAQLNHFKFYICGIKKYNFEEFNVIFCCFLGYFWLYGEGGKFRYIKHNSEARKKRMEFGRTIVYEHTHQILNYSQWNIVIVRYTNFLNES